MRWYRIEWDRHLDNLFAIASYMDPDREKCDFNNLKKRYALIGQDTILKVLDLFYDVHLLTWMENKLAGTCKNEGHFTIDFPKMWKDMEKKPCWEIYVSVVAYMHNGVYQKMNEEYQAKHKLENPNIDHKFATHVILFFF